MVLLCLGFERKLRFLKRKTAFEGGYWPFLVVSPGLGL